MITEPLYSHRPSHSYRITSLYLYVVSSVDIDLGGYKVSTHRNIPSLTLILMDVNRHRSVLTVSTLFSYIDSSAWLISYLVYFHFADWLSVGTWLFSGMSGHRALTFIVYLYLIFLRFWSFWLGNLRIWIMEIDVRLLRKRKKVTHTSMYLL